MFSKTEVAKFEVQLFPNQEVVRLNIPMHDGVAVQVVQRVDDLMGQVALLLLLQLDLLLIEQIVK